MFQAIPTYRGSTDCCVSAVRMPSRTYPSSHLGCYAVLEGGQRTVAPAVLASQPRFLSGTHSSRFPRTIPTPGRPVQSSGQAIVNTFLGCVPGSRRNALRRNPRPPKSQRVDCTVPRESRQASWHSSPGGVAATVWAELTRELASRTSRDKSEFHPVDTQKI